MENKTKIKLYSKTEKDLSEKQIHLMFELNTETMNLEKQLYKEIEEIDWGIFLLPLIYHESVSSGLIENTQTQMSNIAYDIEGIDDVYHWQTRNIINAYRNVIKDLDNNMFFLSIETLKKTHYYMYSKNMGKKFKLNYDPSILIKHIKPGYILNKKNEQNWIGKKLSKDKNENLRNAKMIPINPELKEEYLKDMFDDINKGKYITKIVSFHPFFESIHPFADGNGRVGRLLLSALMIKLGFSKLISLNISYVWLGQKERYYDYLNDVALSGNLKRWNDFFIESLITAKSKAEKQISKTLEVWNKYNKLFKKESIEFYIFKKFMKYHKLNKKYLIKSLRKKYSKTTVYNAVNRISKKLNIVSQEGYLIFNDIISIWK